MRPSRLAFLALAVLCGCDPTGPDTLGHTRLVPLSRNDQVDEVGTRIPASVRVVDGRGNPRGGLAVTWEIVEGTGGVDAASARAAGDGTASAELVLGHGVNRLRVRVEGTGAETVITAHGCSPCGTWSRLAGDHAIGGRAWAGATELGGQLWIVGGEQFPDNPNATVDALEPGSQSWTRVSELERPLSGTVVATLRDRIHVIGGWDPAAYPWNGMDRVRVFDPARGSWADAARLATHRYYAAGAVLNGRIHVVGGMFECDIEFCEQPLASHEIYDPATNRWVAGPPMREPRVNPGAAALEGKLYVAGGTTGLYRLESPLQSVEVFDPVHNGWSAHTPLPDGGPAHLVVLGGTMYALVSTRASANSRLYEYDRTRDRWNRVADAPLALYGPAVVAHGSALHVIGGYVDYSDIPFSRTPSRDVFVFHRGGGSQ